MNAYNEMNFAKIKIIALRLHEPTYSKIKQNMTIRMWDGEKQQW
jgi:hypothetical protein